MAESTFFSAAEDGVLPGIQNADYATVQGGAGDAAQTGNATGNCGQAYLPGTAEYTIWRMVLFFDTSSLPTGCAITAAKLYIKPSKISELEVHFDLTAVSAADIGAGLVPGDFHDLLDDTDSMGLVGTSGAVVDTYLEIELNAAGLAAITDSGVTKFALRSSRDISATAPSTDAGSDIENIVLYLNEQGGDYRPKLVITHTESSNAPEVTTDAASGITSVSATLNGTLDEDGGVSCDCCFEWGRTTNYGTTTAVQSKTETQSFEQALTDLLPNTLYHFRAKATNDYGTAYGDDAIFLTPSPIQDGSGPGGGAMEGLVGSLRHTWRPGSYRLEIGVGGYGRGITTITSGDITDAEPEPEPDLIEPSVPAMKYYPSAPKKKKKYEELLGPESPWAYEEEAIEKLGPASKDFLRDAPWRTDPKGLSPEAMAHLERARKAYFVKLSKERGAAYATEYFGGKLY